MKRLAHAVAAVGLALSPALSLDAQQLPAATELVAKHIQAIGGKDALMKVTSIHQKQKMEVAAAGLSAAMETFAAAPNKLLIRTTIPGIGEMLQGSDGSVAWDINPMQGSRVLEGKELEQNLEAADFYGNRLFLPEKFKSMQTVALSEFNGEQAYKVLMVRTSGDSAFSYFSAKDGFLIGSEASQETQMGRVTVLTKVSDYKDVDGIKYATRTEMMMGPNSIVTTVLETTVNSVADSVFDPPAEIKALVAKP